jgi:geranylgeranyl diphosphate synthase, type II
LDLNDYLEDVRGLVLEEIERIVPSDSRRNEDLYRLVLDYPLRKAKMLRPAIAIAVCRAMGGKLQAILPTAAVLELYHNAFLIHDDVEDGSLLRRDKPTLHQQHGMPIAVNVGDAMLALALGPLLDNMQLLDLGRALRILEAVRRMAVESTEGQAMELAWVRNRTWELRETDYLRMVHKKTSWYTFLTPMVVGGIAAGASSSEIVRLRLLGSLMGAAFQIKDDLLNLQADEREYGKEIGGDLWEGKHTLMLIHFMRSAPPEDVERAQRMLTAAREDKLEEDVSWLLARLVECGSMDHGGAFARNRALAAKKRLENLSETLRPGVHRDFLEQLMTYVVARDK